MSTALELPAGARAARGPVFTSVQESALKKATWRLVPLLTIAYLFSYLDRQAIGFGALTMGKDLGLSATQIGTGAAVFFLSYVTCEIPSNMALYKFGARRWIARIMISWGLVSAAMAFVTGPYSLYTTRFFLGLAEAGFFPGVTFYLAAWFPREYRTRILAWFLVAVPASSLVGGPICGLLLQMDGILGLAGWKWMFIAVSIPATLIGFVILRVLSDRPEDTSWLSKEESDAIIAMRAAETFDRPKSSVWGGIFDARIMVLALVQFGFTLGSYGIGIWLPLIMQEYGLSNLAIGFLTFPVYLAACIAMMLWAWHVDRTGKKIANVTMTLVLATAGLLGYVVVVHSFYLALTSLTLAVIGVTSARGIFWSIPPRLLTGAGAAAGLAFINSVGTSGGFAGPYLMGVLKDWTGNFTTGVLVMAAIMVVTTILSASLKLLVKQE